MRRCFTPITPDLSWNIVPSPPVKVETIPPRLLKAGAPFAILAHSEKIWGNVTSEIPSFTKHVDIQDKGRKVVHRRCAAVAKGWTNAIFPNLVIEEDGDYLVNVELKQNTDTIVASQQSHITISPDRSTPRVFFGDLHVHSDDTVGTESSAYNFTYGYQIAELNVLGYTENDFQVTKERWDATVKLVQSSNKPGEFIIFPGTEWCGNSAAGSDHNVVFLADIENPST